MDKWDLLALLAVGAFGYFVIRALYSSGAIQLQRPIYGGLRTPQPWGTTPDVLPYGGPPITTQPLYENWGNI